jgi:hypothetical protein
MSYPLGGRVTLSGAAHDREDREVPDAALAWSSSIDGVLGTGPELMTRGLSAGRHTIVLEATDSAGASAQASIELIVDGTIVDAGPPPELDAAIAGILERLGSGLDPSPVAALGPAPGDGIPTPVLLAIVIALLAVAGTSVWIRMAQPHVGASGEMAMKDSKIGENAPPAEPRRQSAFRNTVGLDTETEIVESPVESPVEPPTQL